MQEWFVRSTNGKPLRLNSAEMVAIVAYTNWLSQGVPLGSTVEGRGLARIEVPQETGRNAGSVIYMQQCAMCHGIDGAGIRGKYPPIWGSHSYNDGTGMSKIETMATFLKANMPQDTPGRLSAQEAYNIAAFVNAKPRPRLNPQYAGY